MAEVLSSFSNANYYGCSLLWKLSTRKEAENYENYENNRYIIYYI